MTFMPKIIPGTGGSGQVEAVIDSTVADQGFGNPIPIGGIANPSYSSWQAQYNPPADLADQATMEWQKVHFTIKRSGVMPGIVPCCEWWANGIQTDCY